MTVDLHSDKSFLIFLSIENVGGSMARDVTFEITPKLESEALPIIPTLRIFDPKGGIAAMPPGKGITTAFDFWPQRVKRTDLPDMYEAVARYSGEPRRVLFWERPRRYRDPPYAPDLRVYRDSIPEQRKDLHDIHAVLVKIHRALEKSAGRTPRRPYASASRCKASSSEKVRQLACRVFGRPSVLAR